MMENKKNFSSILYCENELETENKKLLEQKIMTYAVMYKNEVE